MDRGVRKVPYGYVEEKDSHLKKGTLVYYDTFQDVTEQQLTHAAGTGESTLVHEACTLSLARGNSKKDVETSD